MGSGCRSQAESSSVWFRSFESQFSSFVGNIHVRGDPIEVYDSYRKKLRKVFPVFVFAFADTPARRSWNLTIGATGFSGCDKCGIRGTRSLPDDVEIGWTAFIGYKRPCEAVVLNADKKVSPVVLLVY